MMGVEVICVRTPGSVLAALEIREDFSMIERRAQSPGRGLSLAVASAGSDVLLSNRISDEAEATILLDDDSRILHLVGVPFAVGTARLTGLEIDEFGLWARPIQHGIIQTGDVVRAIPHEAGNKKGPFPRMPDGLPDAPHNGEERFSAPYEKRAEHLWEAMIAAGCQPSFEWAGTEDGEALVGRDGSDSVLLVIDLEDPTQQNAIDTLIATGDLASWITEELQGRTH